MQVHISVDADAIASDFAAYFAEWASHQGVINLALSGGSTPKALFRCWAAHYHDSIDWEKIRFFWGDERCVPPDDEESNYRWADELFLSPLGVPQAHIFRIRGEAPPEQEAQRYAQVLQQLLPSRNGLPAFDLILLGMGEDGHTASIFPNQMELLQAPGSCAVAAHPETGQQRITLTGKVINNTQAAVFLAAGAGKAQKVREIIGHLPGSEQYPAAGIHPFEGSLHWFLDEAAAQLLAKA
jgi:6-phosphogluconolactonase